MKKSYDYFKMLKEMSECISRGYFHGDTPDRYKKEILLFYGISRELSERLSEEFVAPIERNDIYHLSAHLSKELLALDFIDYISLHRQLIGTDDGIYSAINIQTDTLLRLSDRKNYTSLLRDVSSAQTDIIRVRQRLSSDAKEIIGKCDNALLRYVYFDKKVRFIECIYGTFSEIERVIINNS